MTQRDIAELLTILSKAYPSQKHEDMRSTLAIWTGYFAEYDKAIAFEATKHYISGHASYPSIASLKKCIEKFNTMKIENIPSLPGQTISENEAGPGCAICPYDDFCHARESFKCFV